MSSPITRRTVLTAAGATLAGAALGSAAPGSAALGAGTAPTYRPPAGPRLSLPEPTGRHPVGTRTLHLIDRARTDPLAPTPRHRELMVRLWYPAARWGRRAAYLGPGLSATLVAQQNALTGTDYPADLLTFPTHSHRHAPAPPSRRRLVLFSPGQGTNAAFYTGLLEQLASRGYLVAGIDHTFDAVVEFPDGRLEVPAREVPLEEQLPVRVADARFVLDRLIARFHPTAVAAVGHSLGSITAVATIAEDRRIDAGVAMDGNPLGGASLARPFLLMGNAGRHRREVDPDWAAFYDRLRGPRLHLVVEGVEHNDFSDFTMFKSMVELGPAFAVGPLDGARALHIQRTYVTAWLDYALSGRRPDRLLRDESPDFPEVDFEGVSHTIAW
jgi:dienelactone hydrolase